MKKLLPLGEGGASFYAVTQSADSVDNQNYLTDAGAFSATPAKSLELVSLTGFGRRKVTDLSGGEQQRVALARALGIRPRLLMFDEPLGALDRSLREDLLNELRRILHQTKIPAIYVTHDQEEAFTIADRVMILHNGQIIREGAPADVWANPQSVFVAEFLVLGNIFDGEVRGKRKDERWEVESNFGIFSVDCNHKHSKGDKVKLLSRVERSERWLSSGTKRHVSIRGTKSKRKSSHKWNCY